MEVAKSELCFKRVFSSDLTVTRMSHLFRHELDNILPGLFIVYWAMFFINFWQENVTYQYSFQGPRLACINQTWVLVVDSNKHAIHLSI